MSNKKLSVLGVIAVLMAALAVVQSRINQNVNTADFSSAPLVGGLQIDAVSAVSITGSNTEGAVTLNRSQSGFVVADLDHYPADTSKINSVINSCLDIRTHDEVTDNPANHADLKMTDETARYQVSFLDADGGEIVGVLISEADERGAAFARLSSADEVYSIQSPPSIPTGAMDFVDAQLLQVPQDQMASVAVQTGSDTYILTATEDGSDVQLKDMPAGKQFKEAAYKSVFGALNSVRFEDVLSDKNTPEDVVFDSSYICKLKDKTVYKLALGKKDDMVYVKVSAEYMGKTPTKEQGVESEEQLKEKETILLAIDAAKQFTQKHSGWVYQVSSFNAENLTKPLSEILEDVPEAEEVDTAAPVGAVE